MTSQTESFDYGVRTSALDLLFDERIALVRKLADQRQFADAITLFNWLCETYPDRAAAVIDSANAFSKVYDYTGVAMRFAGVESRGAAPTEVWLAMAEISERLRRPAWAERFLSNAVGNATPSAQACGLFALYCEHANQLDQAAELFDRGLKIDSSNGICHLAKAKVLRRQKSLDAAEKTLDLLLKNESALPRTRISGWYELAHVKDAQDNPPAAIAALIEAKRLAAELPEHVIFQQRATYSEKTHHRFLTTLDADYFKSADWQPTEPHRLALLGGHPRSGTTLLEQILDSHSDIISAEETAVFGNGVNDPFIRECVGPNLSHLALQIPRNRLEQFRSVYFATMELVLDQQLGSRLLIDKNPSYTDCLPVFARVFPEASFIMALRDPRDVVLSCFFQDLPVNDVTVHFSTLSETAMRYANTMAMWLVCRENMDEKKWIEVRYESLVSDLETEAKKVMRFLNLNWQEQQKRPQDHARNRKVLSPTYAQVTQPVHKNAIGKWKRYERWLGEAMPMLETFIEAFEY